MLKNVVPTSTFCSRTRCHSSVTVNKAELADHWSGKNPHWFGDSGQITPRL